MTAEAINIIITAEIAEQKVELGTMALEVDDQLDERIHQAMLSAGKYLYTVLLKNLDDGLREAVPKEWQNLGREERQLMSSVGWAAFKRRVYRDEKGRRRKPLDEVLGIKAHQRYSVSVQQKASFLTSELPYREASEILGWLLEEYVSHSTIGRMMQQVGESYQAREEDELERVFERGEDIQPGHIPAKVLYGESDGVWISLQREEKRKVEARVAVFYTDKKVIGTGRKALENKVEVTRIVKNSQEWQETLLKTAYKHYDLTNTTQLMVGGDGNSWVRHSFDLLGLPSEFVLDRYHLYREARRAFGFTRQTGDWITQICQEGLEAVLPHMLQVVSQASPKAAEKMRKFIMYMVHNQDGLMDPDCRTHLKVKAGNLGTIEGNVDKLVVRRLKGRGRSWSLKGAQAMLAVCLHKQELKQNAFHPFEKELQPKMRHKVRRRKQLDGDWCQAGVPSLHLCHANRPWALYLRKLIHPEGDLVLSKYGKS